MNPKPQSWPFLCAGALAALLLAAITVFSLRTDVPADAASFATTIDIVLQTAFGLACLWAVRLTGIAASLPVFVDHGTPSLRSLGVIAPWLVLLQVAMGAALRYKMMGAMSHVAGAMLVGAFLLYYATGVMAPAPKGHAARGAAVVLLWAVLVQVLLGIAAYVIRFSNGAQSGLPDTRLFSILHIITGAIVLGATFVLAHLVHKSSTKQEAAGLPSTGAV